MDQKEIFALSRRYQRAAHLDQQLIKFPGHCTVLTKLITIILWATTSGGPYHGLFLRGLTMHVDYDPFADRRWYPVGRYTQIGTHLGARHL